ncbi:ATP-binding cassette domain-containing protein [Kocuria flava]|uniref:ABC transporter ATP-binding protein n=1 Tax=Kocuria flava TaxID=446860 RepID=UPI002F95D11B
MSEPLVHIEGFRMVFGDTTVVEDLSFDVHAGETFGFLGSNGSGKTTTLRALLGIYQPTAGILHINGKVFEAADGARLGYLPEERGLYKKEPVLETMVYFGQLKGLDKTAARAWSLEYLERVGLTDKASTRLDKLSGGQQQKVQLGVTTMNTPDLLILDEPTKGFDPVNRRLLMDIIEDQQKAGATVVMVTHQMEEVERLCDRVILLKDGRRHAYGTVREVQEQFGGTVYRVHHTGVVPASHHYTVVTTEPAGQGQLTDLAPAPGASESVVLAELVGAGVPVSGFTTVRTSMEEIFLRVYGTDSLQDADTVAGVGV